MSTDLTDQRKSEILNSFIQNPEFYKNKELEGVRNVIASHYFNDFQVIDKITSTSLTRSTLSSPQLLQHIMNEISGGRYALPSEEISEDLFLILTYFNRHEDKFLTNQVAISSLDFFVFLIQTIDKQIIIPEKQKNYSAEIQIFYEFFKRIISKIKLRQTDQGKYQGLFDKIEQVFSLNNYKNATTWFKFYFYFRDKKKFNNNIESHVVNHVSTLIRISTNAKILKSIIEETIPLNQFINLDSNYQNEIYKKCLVSTEFAVEFYSSFDNSKKQSILENWIQKSSNQATLVLKEFEEVPDGLKLAEKILVRANSLNNNLTEKKGFIDLLFKIGLTKEEILKTSYTNQVKNLICNVNLNLHNFGIKELEEHREFIDTKSLKPAAENFIVSYLSNPNTYNKQIENIINSKLGITTLFVDKHLNNNPNILNALSSYLVNSGNLSFYDAITSKLSKSNINKLNEKFINTINKQPIYSGILKRIKNIGLKDLSESAAEKLKLYLD